ncbi:hypothetical protein HYW54_03555 [Candidatus Gottesmanbacteria bacterium]|nr:hypothetical protein [Candidatus Gottesmanbacteria bacterium]
MKLTPKLFASLGLVLTAVILLSAFLFKSSTSTPTPTPTPTPIDGIINPDKNDITKEQVLNLAIEDLTETENIKKEDIKVKSIEEREWSDSSLGCPKPGYFYAQVITPGYQIVLEARQNQYTYHTSLEDIVRCN